MSNFHFRVAYLETEIKKSYGENFENLASFIMYLIDPRYHPTRTQKDGGVDGIKIIGTGRAIYSAYGPHETTEWNRAKVKLNKDAFKAKEFSEKWQIPLKKWCIILNRNLSGNEYELIWNICKTNGINRKYVQILTPKTLVAEIEKNGFSITVARFLGLINYNDYIHYTDLQPHAFASQVLQKLTKIKEEDTETKRIELNKILDGVVSLTYLYNEKEKIKKTSLYKDILFKTRIGRDYVKSYVYLDGVFKELYISEISSPPFQPSITLDSNENFVITVRNLYIIYRITKLLLADINSYNIEQVLRRIYKPQFNINRA